MIPGTRFLSGLLVPVLLLLAIFAWHAPAAEKPELLVAISLDMPPYVMDEATGGLEVDIVRQALQGYDLRFLQLPYSELQTAIQQKGVDVSLGVEKGGSDIHFSRNFITFVNYAISKKADGLRINGIADLRNHQVLTWGNAYLELGPEFEELFSPQSPQRKNYIEVADQEDQVRRFWEGKGQVIVIDRSIFDQFSRKMGRDLNGVSFHAIFPHTTDFMAGFTDAVVRDRFDEGLAALCRSGGYEELLRRHGVAVEHTVCD